VKRWGDELKNHYLEGQKKRRSSRKEERYSATPGKTGRRRGEV